MIVINEETGRMCMETIMAYFKQYPSIGLRKISG
jgi:hypothetical protein